MSMPRARRLLAALPEKESRAFERAIASARRENTRRLHALIMSGLADGEEFDRVKIFEALFGRAYSKREDYLLRNELRLLTNRIYDFIAGRESQRELRENRGHRHVMLMEGLLRRGMHQEFEALADGHRDEAIGRLDYNTARKLNDLRFRHLIQYSEMTPESMLEARRMMGGNLECIKLIYRTDAAINQHQQVVCEENLRLMGRPVENETAVGIDLDFDTCDSPFARYYECVTLAHRTTGEHRIAHATAAVGHLAPVAEYFQTFMVFGYAVLASSCLAERRLAEARGHFEKGLEFARAHRLTPPAEMIFNYITTLLRLGEYRAVLGMLLEYGDELQSRPKLRYRCEYLRCFCHIFLGDPDEALAAIPPSITQRPESEYQNFRFFYLIIPYLRGDIETALREARNFVDYFNRHKEKLLFPEGKEMALLYKRFFTIVANEIDPQARRNNLAAIGAQVEAITTELPGYDDLLPRQWLREAIGEAMK